MPSWLSMRASAESEKSDPELASFYRELFECEARHYRIYVDLAAEVAGSRTFALERLSRIAGFEKEIVLRLSQEEHRATVHG